MIITLSNIFIEHLIIKSFYHLMINKWLIATLLLAIIGAIVFVYNKQCSNEIPDPRKIRNKRIGILFVIISGILMIYLYYTNNISLRVKAKMYPAKECIGCENYAQRHNALRGYHENEYSALKSATESCNTCSKKCVTDLKQQQSRGAPAEIQELTRNDCIDTTQYAMLAKKELDRLTESLNKKKAGITAFKTKYYNDASQFPKIPSY